MLGAVAPSSTQPRVCSVARTLDIVGEKWALLAVREVFLGNRRFDEMIRQTGAPRDTLAARLRTLVETGILERRQYSEHPARYEYYLTEVGKDLYPVILTLRQWGDRHLAGADGPPLVFTHHCGHPLRARLVCESCGEPVVFGHSRPAVDSRERPGA
jgi:DNA-binding HxlR family transcriptional regulator